MSQYGDAPAEVEARLRPLCLALPEAAEQDAWAGTRWRIRQRSFAHVLTVGADHPAAALGPAGADGRSCVLILRSPEEELAALVGSGAPFYRTPWGHDVVGMNLEGELDWTEINELVIESYCVQAPAKLVALVDRPVPP